MSNKWTLLVLLICSANIFAVNLLVNGDFESGTVKGHFANGYPDGWAGWNSNGWHHGDSGYTRGDYGIAIWSNDTGCIQVIPAAGGNRYQVSVEMIYPSSEPLVNKSGVVKIEFWNGPDPSGSKLGEQDIGIMTGAHSANSWHLFSDEVIAPTGTTEARIICMTFSTGDPSTGKAYWDNVAVEQLSTVNDPDYDDNLVVDLSDFAKLASAWLQSSAAYNLVGSEFIDRDDLEVFANSWLASIPQYPGYELVWSDEFNTTSLDLSNWTHETGTGHDGWGNWEWQYYTSRPENCRLENGNLIIEARKESYGGRNFTSARIKTQAKQSFQYGRIEARIKCPVGGEGIWPAFWMLGNNITSVGWPACGELDILELMKDPTKAKGTLHYGSGAPYIHESNGGEDTTVGNMSDDFHIYAVQWDTNQIRWYRDDVNYYTSSTWWSSTGSYPAPFNQPFFIILNFAVGASWWDEDVTNATVTFPQQFIVDYVRVYEKTSP